MSRTLYLLCLLVVVGCLAQPLTTYACGADIKPTTTAYVDNTDIILVGTVTGSNGESPADYIVQVERYLKGVGPDYVLVTGYSAAPNPCVNTLNIGEKWVFMLDGNAGTDAVLHASYMHGQDALRTMNADAIKTLASDPRIDFLYPYWTPIWTLLRYWTYSPEFQIGLLVGVPALLIGGVLILTRKRLLKTKNAL